MKVTVEDCLQLPSFHGARLLAGENNLIKLVRRVTVLDMYSPREIREHYVSTNQMVLTSFSTIRSDEEAQCKAIEALSECGNVAIVVFYVGKIVKYLSDKVIAAAEREGIPLIQVSSDSSTDIGDAITQISSKLFYEKDEKSTNSLITSTIYHLLNFEKYNDFQGAIKAAALNNDFQLILLNQEFHTVLSVETRHRTTIAEAIRLGKENTIQKQSDVYRMIDVNGVMTYWGPITIQGTKYFMFVVDNEDGYSSGEITKLAEIIELAMGMWKYTPKRDVRGEFVRALQRGNLALVYELQKELEPTPNEIYSVYLIKGKNVSSANKTLDELMTLGTLQIIRASEEGEIYGIFAGDISAEEGKKLCNCAYEKLKEDKSLRIFHVTGVAGVDGAYSGYSLIGETWISVQTVFPYKRVFTKYELALVSNCIHIQNLGIEIKNNYLAFLEAFKGAGENKGKQLLETLETFVLDAGMNSGKTAEFMAIHTNTVQYRLKKINEILGVEITGNRVIPSLTIALALRRLEI